MCVCVCVFCSAAPQLVHAGKIDYLVSDYLSEITMSLLTNAKHKSPVSATSVIATIIHLHRHVNLGHKLEMTL